MLNPWADKIKSKASLRNLRAERVAFEAPDSARPIEWKRASGSRPASYAFPAEAKRMSTTYLRPAPPVPILSPERPARFALRSSLAAGVATTTCPSPAGSTHNLAPQQDKKHSLPPREYALPSPAASRLGGQRAASRRGLSTGTDATLVEIPRFKKRALNLGIVRKGNDVRQRAAWCALWFFWVATSFLGLVSKFSRREKKKGVD